ncbi:putative bifunctional diguanylate cyclase/phosphodiesterase [Pseudomonas sp.]|uniref:putative bifunctional diguanylate cyclase/phosphodiesterase n=1 Tax=Pseudomonas sp. TaxID=306 RepID=UPI002729B12E|nr:EAL domain-containing protein [Pseudomonas sp.]
MSAPALTPSRSALRTAVFYTGVAMAWLLFSDTLTYSLTLSLEQAQRVQTVKGALFVLFTGMLVYFASLRQLRRLAEQQSETRRSQERLDLALAGSDDGVWDWDLERRHLYLSARCLAIVGLAEGAETDRRLDWLERIHPEDLQSTREALRSHLRGETDRFDSVHRMRHEEGHWVTLLARGRAIRSDGERACRVIGSVRDITAERAREVRLQQAAVVFDSTNEGVVITDQQNLIVSVNQAFTRITGYEQKDVLGRSPALFKSGWHDDAFYQELWQSLRRKGCWQGEIWNRRANGEIYPQWQTINTVRDAAGTPSHYVAVFADISQIKRSQKELDFLAHHDPLTRLPNRLLIVERLQSALARAKRQSSRLGLVFIDIDRFKTVNDSMGHSAGDDVLRSAAERMAQLCREPDTLARLGGDEFLLLVEDIRHAEELVPLVQRLQRAFTRPFELSGRLLHLNVSLGMSIYPEDGCTAAELLKNADTAVTLAKNSGRNTYAFYTQALTEQAVRQLALESDLHQALKQKQLRVYYQPQLALATHAIVGMEALVRWQHPVMGLIAPDEFLPIAEHAGLLGAVDEFVLIEACRQARRWRDAGVALTSMAVNMSGYWLERGDVVASVDSALAAAGLPADCLELEITEGEIMQRGDAIMGTLDALRERGVKLAIDDFGTGYSSLLRLKRLPVTKLKIDRGFTMDLPGDENDAAIPGAIIALGRSLKLVITAEGVETPEQEALLRELGCDFGQGYFYSRPLPSDALDEWLGVG